MIVPKQVWQALGLMLVVLPLVGCGTTFVTSTHLPAASPTSNTPAPPTPSVYNLFTGKVDVGGHSLFLRCLGKGSPTVIMEATIGQPETAWFHVWPEVTTFTSVCMYDRAGIGLSDAGPQPRTAQQIVDELHTLLTRASIPGPYVLVGHSYGGMLVRLYASQYPNDVVGIVLVNSAHEDQFARAQVLLPPEEPDECFALRIVRQAPAPNPEGVDFEASAAQVRVVNSLGDLPLVVLTAGRPTRFPSCAPPNLAKQMDRVWQELQAELVHLSTNSRHIIAKHSGHDIPHDQPQLVVEAIHQVVEAARKR